jgi:hypothetical protein
VHFSLDPAATMGRPQQHYGFRGQNVAGETRAPKLKGAEVACDFSGGDRHRNAASGFRLRKPVGGQDPRGRLLRAPGQRPWRKNPNLKPSSRLNCIVKYDNMNSWTVLDNEWRRLEERVLYPG